METIPLQPLHTLQAEGGAIYAFCSDLCFEEYHRDVEMEASYVSVKPPTYECLSCYWCGRNLHQVDHCFRHDQRCPDIDWKMTYQANTVIYALAQLIDGEIPDELIDDCEHLATRMAPGTDGRIIARACWTGWKLFE